MGSLHMQTFWEVRQVRERRQPGEPKHVITCIERTSQGWRGRVRDKGRPPEVTSDWVPSHDEAAAFLDAYAKSYKPRRFREDV